MTSPSLQTVFLDANVLAYYLDEDADQHKETVTTLQKFIDSGAELFSSHHAIEETLHVFYALTHDKTFALEAAERISDMPIELVESDASSDFTLRYLHLFQTTNVGLNDCLLLQLIIDNDIDVIYTYDEKLGRTATTFSISRITDSTKQPS